MIESILLAMLVFGGTWAIASVFYQSVVRPVLADYVRFRLFTCRDNLRSLAISQAVSPESFSYQHLEECLNVMIHAAGWYNVGSLLEFYFKYHPLQAPQEAIRFDGEAPTELKKIERRALRSMLISLAANSPGWIVSLAGVLVILVCVSSAKKMLVSVNRMIWHSDYTTRDAQQYWPDVLHANHAA